MSDRVNTLTVVLEAPVRTDDVAALVRAIRTMRGVESVEVGEIDGASEFGARMQERHRLMRAVMNVFDTPRSDP